MEDKVASATDIALWLSCLFVVDSGTARGRAPSAPWGNPTVGTTSVLQAANAPCTAGVGAASCQYKPSDPPLILPPSSERKLWVSN